MSKATKIFNRARVVANQAHSVTLPQSPHFQQILYELPLDNLIEQISYINRDFRSMVFMGSQAHLFIQKLPANVILDHLILWDTEHSSLCHSLDQLHLLQTQGIISTHTKILPMINDEELFCLGEETVDLVVSNNTLHLVNDPTLAIRRMQQSLKPDGVLLGSLFGEETLQELRIAFTLAENERSGGVSQHVAPFQNIQDMGNTIVKCDLRVPTVYTSSRVLIFESVFHLMQFLQDIGQQNPMELVRPGINRSLIDSMAAIYHHLFSARLYLPSHDSSQYHPDSVIATIENIYFSGWKYDPQIKFTRHATQPKKDIDDFEVFAQEIKQHSTHDAQIRMGSIDEDNVIHEKKVK